MNVALVCEKMNMPSSTLNRILKKQTGRTLCSLVTWMRIEHAAGLLVSTGDDVGVIGSIVGIDSPSTFNNVFKEKMGMTPGEYRNSRKVSGRSGQYGESIGEI